MNGSHLIAELYDCQCAADQLSTGEHLHTLCRQACLTHGLTPVASTFHQFGTPQAPAGATGAVILAESHLAVHTWPEQLAVTLDLYVCNFSRDNRSAAERCFAQLIEHFAPRHITRRCIERGAPDAFNEPVPRIGQTS